MTVASLGDNTCTDSPGELVVALVAALGGASTAVDPAVRSAPRDVGGDENDPRGLTTKPEKRCFIILC